MSHCLVLYLLGLNVAFGQPIRTAEEAKQLPV